MGCADIAVALLAAGRAIRFGSDKLMAPLNGAPVGAHIATTLSGLDFGWRFAVCANYAPIAEIYASLGFKIIENCYPERGQSYSLHRAVAEAKKTKAEALLVVLADMPFVSMPHIRRIVAGGCLTVSGEGTARMPPALFPRDYWPELLAASGDRGASALLGSAKIVAAPQQELRDIDVPADLPRPSIP